jgi:REP element-mobilizing transposase RayT
MSYTQLVYHIVLRTKRSAECLTPEHVEDFYRYIWGIVRKKNGVLYHIGGVSDHVHLLSDLHPSIALADFVKDIKVASSLWLKSNGNFPHFAG